jgi:hypothetical protein
VSDLGGHPVSPAEAGDLGDRPVFQPKLVTWTADLSLSPKRATGPGGLRTLPGKDPKVSAAACGLTKSPSRLSPTATEARPDHPRGDDDHRGGRQLSVRRESSARATEVASHADRVTETGCVMGRGELESSAAGVPPLYVLFVPPKRLVQAVTLPEVSCEQLASPRAAKLPRGLTGPRSSVRSSRGRFPTSPFASSGSSGSSLTILPATLQGAQLLRARLLRAMPARRVMRRGGPCRSKASSMPEANLTGRVPVPPLRPRSCRGPASTCSAPFCSSSKRFPEASGVRCGRSQAHLPALALSRRSAQPEQPKLPRRPGRSRAACPPKRARLRVLHASPTEVGGACRAPFRLPHVSPKLPVRSSRAEAHLPGASHRGELRREELESLRSSGLSAHGLPCLPAPRCTLAGPRSVPPKRFVLRARACRGLRVPRRGCLTDGELSLLSRSPVTLG